MTAMEYESRKASSDVLKPRNVRMKYFAVISLHTHNTRLLY